MASFFIGSVHDESEINAPVVDIKQFQAPISENESTSNITTGKLFFVCLSILFSHKNELQ